MARFKYSIVACARWEAPYISEWISYHFLLGFEHFYIYSNDDQSDTLFGALREMDIVNPNLVTYYHFPYRGQQAFMYMHFFDHHAQETEWVMFLDIDEFLNLQRKKIGEIMRPLDATTDALYFNWVLFGNSGHKERPTGSVLLNYTKRQSIVHPYTKNIVRTGKIDPLKLRTSAPRGFWHGWDLGIPGFSKEIRLRTRNPLGHDMGSYYDDFPNQAQNYVNEFGPEILLNARIHHYSMKSEDDFLIRERRGVAGAFVGQSHWGDLHRSGGHLAHLAALNEVSDTNLADLWRDALQCDTHREISPRPTGPNLALGKAATQSSFSEFSIGCSINEDAARAISGSYTGTYAFHTKLEDYPWWRLDLGEQSLITNIRIFNRIESWGFAARARALEVLSSSDDESWTMIYKNPLDNIFGGIDGRPLVIRLSPAITTRFIKLQLLETNFFHLQQVEVY